MGIVHVVGENRAIALGSADADIGALTISAGPSADSLTRPEAAMFTASRALQLADHFRVSYAVSGELEPGSFASITSASGAQLLWPRSLPSSQALAPATIVADQARIPIFATVIGDELADQLLADDPRGWSRLFEVERPGGSGYGSIRQANDGSIFLPFDPDDVCHSYWSERYVELIGGGGRGALHRRLVKGYYAIRALLPRTVQIWLRQRYARIQGRVAFPRWPVETALHDFFDLFLGLLATVAGEPVPFIAPWPDGHDWALVLTHDVETAAGLSGIQPVLELERSLGLRSSWNFVPCRYDVSEELVSNLVVDGFEVGVHGLRHDGRDVSSLSRLQKRLPAMREAARRWNAVGFRSPATHRNWEWMPLLLFEYDSSYPDTAPYEPQSGGCCTWLPFFIQGMVELPMTMPHDHNLFVILGEPDERVWIEKAEVLRERGGMAVMVTHPDYFVDARIFDAYERFVRRYADAPGAWKALPREVSSWWRRRAASRIERGEDGWRVTGPAAQEARIEFATQAR